MIEHKKILVVDDEPVVRDMLVAILSRAGYEVTTASDGATAIERAASEKTDLVILDGLLPKMHGFLACKAIKESDNPPKVILLTGVYTKPTYKSEITNVYRADAALTKPFDRVDLLACIERLLSIPSPALLTAQTAPAIIAALEQL